MDGRLAGVLVLIQSLPGDEGDYGLTQDMLVPAVDSVGASAAGGGGVLR